MFLSQTRRKSRYLSHSSHNVMLYSPVSCLGYSDCVFIHRLLTSLPFSIVYDTFHYFLLTGSALIPDPCTKKGEHIKGIKDTIYDQLILGFCIIGPYFG